MHLWRKLTALFRRSQLDAEMAEELRAHLEMQEAANRAAGMLPTEAHYAARRQFGGVDQIKERCRDQRGWVWLEQCAQDFSYASRQLRKNPGFTTTVVITLALGIGANSVGFSTIKAFLWPPLPVRDAGRVMFLAETSAGQEGNPISYPNFVDWQNENKVFESMAAWRKSDFVIRGPEGPERVDGASVTGAYFRTLGLPPFLGRDFLPEEDRPGGSPVVVLSEHLWRARFGGDASLIGKEIAINNQSRTVVGIVAEGFTPFGRADLFVPLGPGAAGEVREQHNSLYAVARLKPEVTQAQARNQMESIAAAIARQYPASETGHGVAVRSLRSAMSANAQTPLAILQTIVAVVLLICCINTSNMLLAKAAARNREMAVRAALGASRGRLVRQFLAEGVLLAALGGGAGFLLCFWGCDAMVALIDDPTLLSSGQLRPDWTVLALASVLSVLVGLGVSLLPAWRAARTDLHDALRDGGRSGPLAKSGWLRSVLVVAEVVLAMILLVAAGLLTRTLGNTLYADPGFDSKNVLTMQILARGKRWTPAESQATARRMVAELGALPGVLSVATCFPLPLGSAYSGSSYHVEGRPVPVDGVYPRSRNHYVSPEYFRTLSLRFVAGRTFAESDDAVSPAGPSVAVINQTMARTCWPNEDAVGQRFRLGRTEQGQAWVTVVGVVQDTREYGFRDALGEIYFPNSAVNDLVVKTATEPLAFAKAIRARLAEVDSGLVMHDVVTLDRRLKEAGMPQRVMAILPGAFAALALLLAAVGLYGVIAYAVTQRTQEIGVRMALGAQSREVLGMIVRWGMKLAALGVVIGLAVAVPLAGLMRSVLFGVGPTDPVTLVAVPILLLGVTLLACWLPARRAARVNPVEALRAE